MHSTESISSLKHILQTRMIFHARNQNRHFRLNVQARDRVFDCLFLLISVNAVKELGSRVGFSEQVRVNKDGSFVTLVPRAPPGTPSIQVACDEASKALVGTYRPAQSTVMHGCVCPWSEKPTLHLQSRPSLRLG